MWDSSVSYHCMEYCVHPLQGGHGTGKTWNLDVNPSRQGKQGIQLINVFNRENCGSTGNFLKNKNIFENFAIKLVTR